MDEDWKKAVTLATFVLGRYGLPFELSDNEIRIPDAMHKFEISLTRTASGFQIKHGSTIDKYTDWEKAATNFSTRHVYMFTAGALQLVKAGMKMADPNQNPN